MSAITKGLPVTVPRFVRHLVMSGMLRRHWVSRGRGRGIGSCLGSTVGGVAAAMARAGRARTIEAFILMILLRSERSN